MIPLSTHMQACARRHPCETLSTWMRRMVLDRKAFLLSGRIHCDWCSTSDSSDEGTSTCPTCILYALDPPLLFVYGLQLEKKRGSFNSFVFPLVNHMWGGFRKQSPFPSNERDKRKCNPERPWLYKMGSFFILLCHTVAPVFTGIGTLINTTNCIIMNFPDL